MKYIENTRANRADYRPLNHRRRAEMTQSPAWITLAGIAGLIAAIYLATP
jgi:hypothetical protein